MTTIIAEKQFELETLEKTLMATASNNLRISLQQRIEELRKEIQVTSISSDGMIKNFVVVITGTSSGLGLAAAQYLAELGHRVYGIMRGTSQTRVFDSISSKLTNNLFKLTADITKTQEVTKAIDFVLAKEKKIDVLINNAAYALVGTVESCTLEEQQALFDVNYFGAVRMIQAVLPGMRKEKKGHILNISSCCEITAYPILEVYSASKFALGGLSESMASSLAPFNIKVTVLQPGSIKTLGGENQKRGTRDLGRVNPYVGFQEKRNQQSKKNLKNRDDPLEVAKLIEKIIMEQKPNLKYQFGEFSTLLANRRFKDPSGNSEVHFFSDYLRTSQLLPNSHAKREIKKQKKAISQPSKVNMNKYKTYELINNTVKDEIDLVAALQIDPCYSPHNGYISAREKDKVKNEYVLPEICKSFYAILKAITSASNGGKTNCKCVFNDKSPIWFRIDILEKLFSKGLTIQAICIGKKYESNKWQFSWKLDNAFLIWWKEEGEKFIETYSKVVKKEHAYLVEIEK